MAYFTIARLAKAQGIRGKTVTLAPIYIPPGYDRELFQIYDRVVRRWAKYAKESVLVMYAREIALAKEADARRSAMQADAVSVSDDIKDVSDALNREAGTIEILVRALSEAVSGWAFSVEGYQREKFVGRVLTATKVDLNTILHPSDVKTTLEAVLEENMGLIRNVSEQTRQRIAEIFFRNYKARTPLRQVAKEIAEATGLSRKRALRIASDQTTKLAAALDEERMKEAGITKFQWVHSGKVHFRPEHKARDGKVYNWATASSVLKGDLPGVAINCFPSWQPVGFHDDITKLYRRAYAGDLTSLVTNEGVTVSGTPNHPVLTDAGWKPVKAVKVGDYVFEASLSGLGIPNVNIKKRQAAIGDIFAAGKAIGVSVSTHGNARNFHGDGTDAEVEVVDTEGGLRGRIVAASDKALFEPFLEMTSITDESLPRLRALFASFSGAFGPSGGGMSRLGLLESLFWRQAIPHEATGFAGVSDFYALAREHIGEGLTRNAEALAQRFDALASLVGPERFRAVVLFGICGGAIDLTGIEPAPEAEVFGKAVATHASLFGCDFEGRTIGDTSYRRVENIVTRAWSGHVFNLETASGWYSANGIAVKNCGCKAKAIIDLPE